MAALAAGPAEMSLAFPRGRDKFPAFGYGRRCHRVRSRSLFKSRIELAGVQPAGARRSARPEESAARTGEILLDREFESGRVLRGARGRPQAADRERRGRTGSGDRKSKRL